ncbi:hypothetical protein LPK62_27065, partial [Klebsiella pneumoniae]|nr:hypothetical protein [Klebsiella pneumoniae]MCJ5910609.1 hypothetical protein [Klebsiella pneumoniae]OZK33064.1 hypothetical protein CEO82_26890 [Klebsiella pneumoniae]
MMSLWDALRMNMMISYQELVRTFLRYCLINHHQKLLLICKKLFQNFMLSLDGSFACKGVMSRRGECYARHTACGNEKVLIANGEGKRQSKAFLQLR